MYARIDEKMFAASANTEHAGEPHMVSFDFKNPMLDVVVSSLRMILQHNFFLQCRGLRSKRAQDWRLSLTCAANWAR